MKWWIRPSGEDLGRCGNITNRGIMPKWYSGWNLGMDGRRIIQSVIPKRKRRGRFRGMWCTIGSMVDHCILRGNSHSTRKNCRVGHLKRDNLTRTN
jgi:hypothetical protein